MREIKFRFYLPNHKETLNCPTCGLGKIIVPKKMNYFPRDISKLTSELFEDYYGMQYTGLKDKNGKEIYEGDILEITFMDEGVDESGHTWRPGTHIEEVRFSLGIFGVGRRGAVIAFQKLCRQEQVKVLGNIYENPELLEKVND